MKCKNCGSEFDPSNNGQVALRQFHCSKECSVEWNRKTAVYKFKIQKIKECVTCGIEFIPKTSLVRYCSYECSLIARKRNNLNKAPKSSICKNCNTEFKPRTSIQKFCSEACRIQNVKNSRSFQWNKESCEKRKGEKNPCYRNGKYVIGSKKTTIGEKEFIRNAGQLKKGMIDNVGYVYCQHCNTSNSFSFETHHLIYRSEKPNHKYLHCINNLIVLCMKCHNEFHKHKGIRNQIVKDRKLNKLFGSDVLDKQYVQESRI